MRAALLMLVIACGGGTEPVQPPPTPVVVTPTPSPIVTAPACEPVIRSAATRIATESKRVDLATAIDRNATVMIASCEAEAWPANVRTCIAAARLDVDLEACTEELTYRQHQRLHAKIAQLTPAPPRAPIPPSVPTRARPPRTATAKVDCSKLMLAPTSNACQQQYCQSHASDPRCLID